MVTYELRSFYATVGATVKPHPDANYDTPFPSAANAQGAPDGVFTGESLNSLLGSAWPSCESTSQKQDMYEVLQNSEALELGLDVTAQTIEVVARFSPTTGGDIPTAQIGTVYWLRNKETNVEKRGDLPPAYTGPITRFAGTQTLTYNYTDFGTWPSYEPGVNYVSGIDLAIKQETVGGSPSARACLTVDSIRVTVWVRVYPPEIDVTPSSLTAPSAVLGEAEFLSNPTTPVGIVSPLAVLGAPSVTAIVPEYASSYILAEGYTSLLYDLAIDEEVGDATAYGERVVQSVHVTLDTYSDAVPVGEVESSTVGSVVDLVADAASTEELVAGAHQARVDVEATHSADSDVTNQKQTHRNDEDSTGQSSAEIITESQASKQSTTEDRAEDAEAADTVLAAPRAASRTDEVNTLSTSEIWTANLKVSQEFTFEVLASTEVTETPRYRADITEAAASSTEVHQAISPHLDVDAYAVSTAEVTVQRRLATADAEVSATVESQAVELQSDDLIETATAAAGIPVDPITDDLSSWVWARDRIAGFFTDEVESVRVARDSVTTKLSMDIVVDVEALAEWVSDHRGNQQTLEALTTADDYTEGVRSTSQDLDNEAYIGGAVIATHVATSIDIIEDTSATAERLLARLLRVQHVDVDATGRADVAGSVWFKSHSFIEDAGADAELLTEVVIRPTKDDVTAEFGADAEVQGAHLAALAAWSEDTLAETELLGNESGEAWVFNSRTLAFSRYVNFEASQVTTVDHEPAAVGARGLMRYAETFAEGYVKTGLSDYGSPQIKRMRHAYITAASRAPIQLSTLQGIGDTLQSTTYSVATLDSATPYTHRIDLARGDKGQFWAFELRAPAGHRTTLLNLRVQPLLTSRRI